MTQPEEIEIHRVAALEETDLNTFMVAFGEGATEILRQIDIQLSLEFDDQDRYLGMDTYCVSTSWGATHYGGIDSLKLDGATLMLRFEEDAARVLDLPTELTLKLKVDEGSLVELRSGLRRIFSQHKLREFVMADGE